MEMAQRMAQQWLLELPLNHSHQANNGAGRVKQLRGEWYSGVGRMAGLGAHLAILVTLVSKVIKIA
jgi:hypothetical protein